MGEEYLYGDINMKLVLFRVDSQRTDTDDVYAEVGKDNIKFLPPVEFNALVKIEEPKNNLQESIAKLEQSVDKFDDFERVLEKNKFDIDVIKTKTDAYKSQLSSIKDLLKKY